MKKLLVVIALFSWSKAWDQAPDYPTAPPTRTLVKAEYFFNSDPGPGNGTPIALASTTDIANLSATVNLNGSALSSGFHRLYIRIQDDAGNWSLTRSAFFDNVPLPSYPMASGTTDVVEVEYFVDTDPGYGLGQKILVPASGNISSFNTLIDLSGLPSGAHRLYIRSRDASGKWSLAYYAVFDNASQTPYPNAPGDAPDLAEAEYYFDTDPGFGNGTPITIPASTQVSNLAVNIPVGSLSQGRHVFYIRSKQNPWSFSAYAEFLMGSVLPVSWLYVKAETKGTDALVSWATGTEQNTDKFIVEYSRDGSRFQNAGEVLAKNDPSGGSYSFRHIQPGNGVVYYRIKQLDRDGKHTYSKTMVLLFKDGMKAPLLFPNPASDVFHLVMPVGVPVQGIEIYDASGRLVKKEQLNNIQTMSVSVAGLKPGQYIILVRSEKGTESLPLIKN